MSEIPAAVVGRDEWTRLATQLRVDSIRSTTRAASGHPTSSMSAADLMAVLRASHLRYDVAHPSAPGNDQLGILEERHVP